MMWVGLLILLGLGVVLTTRPLLPRDRADHVSAQWRMDHIYRDGRDGN